MRPISAPVKKKLELDPRMKLCPLRHNRLVESCEGRVQWDHVWIYANHQIDEVWAIVGVCEKHHKEKDGDRYIKRIIERESLLRSTPEDLAKYPRKNWQQIKKSLGL